MTGGTGQTGDDRQERTVKEGLSGQECQNRDYQDRTTRTWKLGQT
jgi:hypothetical protein